MSTVTPAAPTVTVQGGADPCPRAEVFVPLPGVGTLTVWRHWGNGETAVVRGANNTPVAGDHLVVDYEVPLQTPVTYDYQFVASGVHGTVSAMSTPVTIADTRVWLQDPLDPSGAVPVLLSRDRDGWRPGAVARRGAFGTATYTADGDVTPVLNSSLPVASRGRRRRAEQIPLEWRTPDVDTTDAVRALIMQANPVLARTGSRVPLLPYLAYLDLPAVTERYVYGPDLTIWTATAQMVAPPGAPVLIPTRTYDQVDAEAATYTDLTGLYATYTDLLRG